MNWQTVKTRGFRLEHERKAGRYVQRVHISCFKKGPDLLEKNVPSPHTPL